MDGLTISLRGIGPGRSSLAETQQPLKLIIGRLRKFPGVGLFDAVGEETAKAAALDPRPHRHQDGPHPANERKPFGGFLGVVRKSETMGCPGGGKREDHDQRRQGKEGMTVGLADVRHKRSKQAERNILMANCRLSICVLFLPGEEAQMEGGDREDTAHEKFMLKSFSWDSNLPEPVGPRLVRKGEACLCGKMMQQFKISHVQRGSIGSWEGPSQFRSWPGTFFRQHLGPLTF